MTLSPSSLVRGAACLALLFASPLWAADAGTAKPAAAEAKVSYSKQIAPIFQAHCIGCHQPAKAQGGYTMTRYESLFVAGDKSEAPIVKGKPDASYLMAEIRTVAGKHEMPKNKPALDASDVELIGRWIEQGASNDSSASAAAYDAEHPPVYPRAPVVAALAVSPDGKLVAIAGFHEVLLRSTADAKLEGRLIGLSERIESIQFSPDGTRLAVAGGSPCRMGEVQIWDVAQRKLKLSYPVGYDCVRGISWSPDGKLVAFACPDNNVRAIDTTTGLQVLAQGAHSDWPLDTVFSSDGSHLISVGRDRATKLTEVSTQRFMDNITSITPGALKGGINAVARHPQRDEIVVGGADGQPKVYRVHRLTKRVIGDDANLIRELPAILGRVNAVAISRDGKRILAGSSLDQTGELAIYGYEFNTELPAAIKAIVEKVASSQNAEEKATLAKYVKEGVKQLAKVRLNGTGIYAVAFLPDGKQFLAAGSDGAIHVYDTESAKELRQFPAVPVTAVASQKQSLALSLPKHLDAAPTSESLPADAKIVKLDVQPEQIRLDTPFAYAQLVVTATLANGDSFDVTRLAQVSASGKAISVHRSGLIRPLADGSSSVQINLAGSTAKVPVTVSGQATDFHADYIRDVMPVTSRSGCNQGTCHGSAQGKNGFKLSLRGYDPIYDVRSLTDEHASRRVNLASPDDSLMLLKASGAVPHAGGQLTKPGEPYYELLKNWIAHGASLDGKSARVQRIEVFPHNPIVQAIGAQQQLRVVAHYGDGSSKDVTHEAFLDSGNTDVATASRTGLITSVRRGEAPILVRFEGAYAATTLTVMGERKGFVWKQPETFNRIDELTAAKWQRMKILPSDLCGDAEYMRRVSLDLTGLPPSADELRAFLADARPTREKREALVDRLIGSPAYVEYWTNKWADLLQVNRKYLGAAGASNFRKWIRTEVAANTPYDQFARKLLTASGSNRENPPAAYFKILREPTATMENTTHLFLAVRFNCNKCHDHPFEKWTQDQYYQTSAYFAQVHLKEDPASNGARIGGTAVEGGKPMYEEVFDAKAGEVLHDRTKEVAAPKFPYESAHEEGELNRRQRLANWITSKDNQYFAKSYVNRLWGYLFGVGIIEPIDDIRAGNPASNPELLEFLTQEFIRSNFDAQHVLRLIAKSRTYQLSVASNAWNADDKINYSHSIARRLPAEVLYDSIYKVAGSVSKIPGLPPGTRAAELPDSGVELPSGFLGTLGRPVRESACECERTAGLQLGPVMALVNGPTIAEALGDPQSELVKLVASQPDDAKLIDELFMRILNRPATPAEIRQSQALLAGIAGDHAALQAKLAEREKVVAPLRVQQEAEHLKAMAKAKAELDAYVDGSKPEREKLERERLAKIAQLQKAIDGIDATVAQKLPEQEKIWLKESTHWQRLAPTSLKSTNGAKLSVQDDLSIFATGKQGKTTYTITAKTEATSITGFRIEMLPDDRLPAKGPGCATNGNLVLNQFNVQIAPLKQPKAVEKVELKSAKASFSQDGFAAKNLIDPASRGNKGWALMGGLGTTQWAVLETKKPIGYADGTLITFTLPQNYDAGDHSLGRFRLSVTTAAGTIPLGIPDAVLAILAEPADQRDAAQQALLLDYLKRSDKEHADLAMQLAEAKKPLRMDPKLKELQDALAAASKPLPLDDLLAQLRQDVAMSQQQLANSRLTGAQDIAWALINSPAFLFNR